jgi:uncharacterized protein YgfB (UPF0149 family)
VTRKTLTRCNRSIDPEPDRLNPDPVNPDPMDAELPDSAELASALQAVGLAIDPSELHGSLCGYIAGGGHGEADDWLQRLALDVDIATAAGATSTARSGGGAIDRLHAATLTQFAAQDFGFELLLPSDDASLAERVDAVLNWCRGFLGGFGLAAPKAEALSNESAEALQDIARIAASDLAYDDSETDEAALAEIVEYVRIAVQLLHGDCAQRPHRQRRLH